MLGMGPTFTDDGTKAPVATGHDPLFPDDCGRDEDEGTGKLCFPDGLLCQNSELLDFSEQRGSFQTGLITGLSDSALCLVVKELLLDGR